MFSMSSVNLLWPYTYITAISSRKAIRVRPVAPKLKIENQGEPSGAKVTMGANCPNTRQVFSYDVGTFVWILHGLDSYLSKRVSQYSPAPVVNIVPTLGSRNSNSKMYILLKLFQQWNIKNCSGKFTRSRKQQ